MKLSRNGILLVISVGSVLGIIWQTGWRRPAAKCQQIADAMRAEDWGKAYDLLDTGGQVPYGDDRESFIKFVKKYVAPKSAKHDVRVDRIESPVYAAPAWRISLRSDAVPKRELLGFVFQPIGTVSIGQFGGTPVAAGWTYQGKPANGFALEKVATEWYPPPTWMAQYGADGYEISIYRFLTRESEAFAKMGVKTVMQPDASAYSVTRSKFVLVKDLKDEMELYLRRARQLEIAQKP